MLEITQMRQMLKVSPFPRFEGEGLLDISEDERYFVVNPALLEALTPQVKERLRKRAVERLAEHFGEEERIVETRVEGRWGKMGRTTWLSEVW